MRRQLLLSAGCLPAALGGVVVLPGGEPRAFSASRAPATNAASFFRGSAENEFAGTQAEVLMSSWSNMTASPADIYPSGDSFVRGAIQAWGEHLHLVIRPEEVWFTILVQLNFYMNAHADEIRSLFVDHAGQEVIYIEDFTWHAVLLRFQHAIQARVKTPWLLDWLRPNFTTTTPDDLMTANILLMGLTKAYFKFEGGIVCGLPSVTLLGTEADWVALLAKLSRLEAFGPEPAAYAARLRPILTRFAASFRAPDAPATRAFWNALAVARAYRYCGAAPLSLTGWIAGFFYWDDRGRPYARPPLGGGEDLFVLDGVTYPNLDVTTLPVGYARAPFVMRDFRDMPRFEAYVAAGAMGKRITPGPPEGYAEAGAHATLQPLSAWVLYGPVQHNETGVRWVAEGEIAELVDGVKVGLVDGVCMAK
ncbi:hypothetical protein B0H67DRAFT_597796 [Lasiosphaeris hirsuta]|uniref:Uncharacterized protein n=1 Tax=Lasiosphaeris hirsuta TaxID=260670 RepID=A0AA40EEA1_9PEZI|nr:hypothetical protein B0H67DRAFT_597796 [Lasiosphaeris hirsuta]